MTCVFRTILRLSVFRFKESSDCFMKPQLTTLQHVRSNFHPESSSVSDKINTTQGKSVTLSVRLPVDYLSWLQKRLAWKNLLNAQITVKLKQARVKHEAL